MSTIHIDNTAVTPGRIKTIYQDEIKISMVTAYDSTMAQLVESAGVEIILVGDSLATVIQGEANTLAVTLEEMIYHTKLVSKVTKRSLVVADMPFLSYQTGTRDALLAAGRLIKEGKATAVKVEGGKSFADTINTMTQIGIPVMGHIGLQPQKVNILGGYRLQGREESEQLSIIEDAKVLEEAGCFAIVLECIPEALGKVITDTINIPTIGIGAGRYTSGQVLVFHDLLGLYPTPEHSTQPKPKFVKNFANLTEVAITGLSRFVQEVKSGEYPGMEQVYHPVDNR